jgi:hypothetical protein
MTLKPLLCQTFAKWEILMQGSEDISDQAWMAIDPGEAEARAFLQSGKLLAHYTNAVSEILKSNNLRFRNARKMSDLEEIKFGRNCVEAFIFSKNTEIELCLDKIGGGLYNELMSYWSAESYAQIEQTYISSFTEIDEIDEIGSAFHWENYGRVAICFDPKFIKNEPSTLSLFFRKVIYGEVRLIERLEDFLSVLRDEADLLKKVERSVLLSFLRNNLFFASVATKRVSFSSEREWRLMYSPCIFSSAEMMGDAQQNFYVLQFQKTLQGEMPSLDTKNLIRKILIHPNMPRALDFRHGLIAQLKYLNVKDAAQRIKVIG